MKLDPYVRDYRAYLNELAGVVDAPATRFYLDTSLLLWLVRLGATARQEFLTWCQGRSVKVPVWSAHEFHHHIVDNTLSANMRTLLGETQKKVDEFVRLAAERADEGVCRAKGYAGRQSFVSDVEQAFVKFREFANVVSDETGFGEAAQEVIEFVNAHVLGSDLSPIVEKLGEFGEFRYGHRMPPGFHDKKDENRFGDVVIWEEIQADVKASNPTSPVDVVFISRDDKTDWVSAARMVAVDEKRTKANRDQDLDVIRPHPLLVHEFAAASSNGRIYVLQPGLLASVVDYASRTSGSRNFVSTWLAAAHRPDLLSELAGAGLVQGAPIRPSPDSAPAAPTAQTAPPTAVGEQEPALRDIMGSDVTGDVVAYARALPRDQEQSIRTAQDELAVGTTTPIKFGRLLAELALEGHAEVSSRIPAIVEGLKRRLDPSSMDSLVLAIAASAYFDKYAQLLKRPRQELRSIVVSLESDGAYRSAFVRLRGFLEDKGAELPYVPGSGRQKVPFKFEILDGSSSGLRIVRQVRVGDQTALIDSVPESSDRSLSKLLGRSASQGFWGKELRMLIAEQYFIPPDLLSDQLDKKKFTWLQGTGLVPIDTTSAGGLSALDDDEDIDRE